MLQSCVSVRTFSKLLQAIAKIAKSDFMSYNISYILCLVSYVFHVALAYVLMFRDAYVCFLCFVISFPNPTRVARSCSITNCIVLSVLFLFRVLVLIHSYV